MPSVIATYCLLSFLVVMLTGANNRLSMPHLLSLENLTLGLALATGSWAAWHDRRRIDFKIPYVVFVLASSFVVACLFSSFGQRSSFDFLNHPGWRLLAKLALVAPFFVLFLTARKSLLVRVVFACAVFQAAVVIFETHVDQLIDPDTGRPIVLIGGRDNNVIAMVIGLVAPLILVELKDWLRARCYLPSALTGAGCLVLLVGLVTTQSRLGSVSAVLALFAGLFATAPKGRRLVAALGATVLLAAALGVWGNGLMGRLRNLGDESSLDRLRTIRSGLAVFEDAPWLGAGLTLSNQYYKPSFVAEGFESEHLFLDVHNVPVQVLADLGLIGGSLYALIWVAALVGIFRSWSAQNRWSVPGMIALVVLSLASLSLPLAYSDWALVSLLMIFSLSLSPRQLRADLARPMSKDVWDQDYRSGLWSYLDEDDEAERYRVLAGMTTGAAGRRILDIGCGTGELASRLPAVKRYLGVDLSESAVAMARQKVDRDGVEFRQGAAETFLPTEAFDVVILNEVAYYIEELPRFLHALATATGTANAKFLISVSDKERAVWADIEQVFSLERSQVTAADRSWTIALATPRPGGS